MVRVPTIDDRSYCVDSTEVTQAQYAQFLQDKKGDATGQDPRCRWNAGYGPSCTSFDPANPHAGLGEGAREYPITCVDWCDAFAFCAWAGKRLCGRIGGGGLPLDFGVNNDQTQSQKYSACSQGGAYTLPYGRIPDPSACNFNGGDGGRVAPAGSYAKCVGGFDGLFDMIGNVQEWEDACDESEAGYASDLCVVRGGDFQDVGFDCRSLYRDNRSDATDWIGFRCCAE
jgi:formylglycine-generating enzyme required for sulfatase activity